jgi:hypothetical protein
MEKALDSTAEQADTDSTLMLMQFCTWKDNLGQTTNSRPAEASIDQTIGCPALLS